MKSFYFQTLNFFSLLFLIFALTLNSIHAFYSGPGACDGDESCVSNCDACPNDQNILGYCCAGYYQNEACNVWSPQGTAKLCEDSSSNQASCQDCLGCQNANDCGKQHCSSTDTGTCCYRRTDPNNKPNLFKWYCNGCANCPDNYYTAAYPEPNSTCRSCDPNNPNDIKNVNCLF